MDKKLLKEFAMKARESLTSLVRAELNRMHITEDVDWTQSGELYRAIIGGNNIVLTIDEKSRYDKLQAAIKAEGIKAIVEKAAYTWFNRIVAIRYMELNEMLPQGKHNEWLGIRVLSDSDNHPDPEILKASNLRRSDLDLPLDVDAVLKLARDEEKFRVVLLAVVKKLGTVMPDVFNGDTNSIDFLLPNNLLGAGGFVSETLKLPTECFDRVEVIGWLYQYYNQAEKDIAMKKKSAVEKDEIPFVTQIFTPDWIVRYMVENSLGRYWLEHGGDENLAKNWKYLIKNSDISQTAAKTMPNIEDVTFIDPCAGSGHIFVYAFEVFYQIYQSLGYAPEVIPENILTHNLYGLDIDDRAKQLSILSALLLARGYDKDIFKKLVSLNITSVAESNGMSGLPELLKGESRDIAEYLVDTFSDAKEYGSILKVKSNDYAKLSDQLDALAPMDRLFYASQTEQLIHQAQILSRKYTVAATNPPYMGSNKFSKKLRTYTMTHYPDSWYDLYAVFTEHITDMLYSDGMLGIITQHNFMFTSSYKRFRKVFIDTRKILNAIHLGPGAFESISGEVVQTIAYVSSKDKNNVKKSVFIRLVGLKNKENEFFNEANYYEFETDNFSRFKDNIFVYSMSAEMLNAYLNDNSISTYFTPKAGIVTGNDDYFIRTWQEVNYNEINFSPSGTSSKYVPMSKGGAFIKWYGNINNVVKMHDLWHTSIPNKSVRRGDSSFYYKAGIGWSSMSGGPDKNYSILNNCVCGTSTPSIYDKHESTAYMYLVLGLLNSKISKKYLELFNPTLGIGTADIGNLPLTSKINSEEVSQLVRENIEITREDYNDQEISWNFKRSPLLPTNSETKISDTFSASDKTTTDRWSTIKLNEERLNAMFIDAYGMRGELTPEVKDDRIGIKRAHAKNDARAFISYFIGVMFGRYSLDSPGINFAGGQWDASSQSPLVDADNIVPVMDKEFYTDDIIYKLRDFLITVYGEPSLHTNMDWLANALGRRANENSEEALRRYFINDFISDHSRAYDGRPIYWLLSSGKSNGFKALFYMHRYQPNLVATVRTQYLLNTQNVYTKRFAELEAKTVLNNDELKLKNDLVAKLAEIKTYDALIAVAASKNVALDLDDGVKVNYPKLSQCAADVKPGSEVLEMKGVKL